MLLISRSRPRSCSAGGVFGKTALCAFTAGTAFLKSTTAVNICLASFSLKNAKAVLWSQLLQQLYPLPSHITHIKSQDMLRNEQTGSTIQLFGLSAEHGDSIRGHSFDLAILDEFSRIPYSTYMEAFRPTLMDTQGWQVLITTPKGSFDLIHILKNEADENPDTHSFLTYPASSVIGQIPGMTKEYLEQQERNDPNIYQLEHEANYLAKGVDAIFDTMLMQHSVSHDPPTKSPSLAVSAGLDFAPRKDKCILAIRNSRNFIDLIELEYNADPYGFVRKIKELVNRYTIRCLAIDRGGAGETISDMLEDQLSGQWPIEDCRGVIAGEKAYHSSNFNTRSELFAMLHDFIAHTPNTIPNCMPGYQRLINELNAITRKQNDAGKFQVISRAEIIEKIGNSPDYASAASLSLYFERYTQNWQKPAEEMTHADISKMSNREILDTFGEFYDDTPQFHDDDDNY